VQLRKKDAAYWREYHAENKGRRATAARRRQREIIETAISHYGGTCACCLERTLEFLTIEGERGGYGGHTRRALPNWLYKNKFPPGFHVLCHNCSEARRRFGYCPHRETVV
jgi:hypothetical protein